MACVHTSTATAVNTPDSTLTFTSTVTPVNTPSATLTPRNPLEDVDMSGRLFLTFPNPAKEQVRFLVNPERSVRVEVFIANLNGERVATVAGTLPPGHGTVVWQCRSVAPGVYLARILMDGKEIGKCKVAVVR